MRHRRIEATQFLIDLNHPRRTCRSSPRVLFVRTMLYGAVTEDSVRLRSARSSQRFVETALIASQRLKLFVAGEFALDKVTEAFQPLASRKTMGKVVLVPTPI